MEYAGLEASPPLNPIPLYCGTFLSIAFVFDHLPKFLANLEWQNPNISNFNFSGQIAKYAGLEAPSPFEPHT